MSLALYCAYSKLGVEKSSIADALVEQNIRIHMHYKSKDKVILLAGNSLSD